MKRSDLVTFSGKPVTLGGTPVKPGDPAPDFLATDNMMQPVTLSNYEGKKRIISVMPSVDTGVCAAQTRRFNEEAARLKDVVILTISMDLPFALKRFCAAEGIENAVTLSDYKNMDFGMKYGFFIEELHLLARGVIVIDEKDYIRYVEYVPEITHHPDYDKALDALKKL